MSDVTRILQAIEKGNAHASEELLPVVYEELRRLAARKMAGESAGHTLQATALVHEASTAAKHGISTAAATFTPPPPKPCDSY